MMTVLQETAAIYMSINFFQIMTFLIAQFNEVK